MIEKELKRLQRKAIEIRINILDMIFAAKRGHIGGSLSSVEILITLYYKILRINPSNPNWYKRDRFILSKGHSCEGYYSILADLGFYLKKNLERYSQFKSDFAGHPNKKISGVDWSTGSLGHGLSVSVGIALAGKMDRNPYKVYVLMGDGELAEGSVWEAAMAGSNYNLDNLIAIIDRNQLQVDGKTENIMKLENLSEKWKSFGWIVETVDGHNISELYNTLQSLPSELNKPYVVIANTIKGKGISFIENNYQWHSKVPNNKDYRMGLEELHKKLGDI